MDSTGVLKSDLPASRAAQATAMAGGCKGRAPDFAGTGCPASVGSNDEFGYGKPYLYAASNQNAW